ncbi:MAG: gliding motility-associated C-terminal domain-containing protein, partial [Saprospiraceae bacterium]|nr:gliding motility-associated C-terminal domain-containing protein [Saprospiraceae bacterium]
NTSSDQNPVEVFDSVSVVNVNLTVKTEIGCTDSTSLSIETFGLPEAEIVGETNVCVGEVALLEGTLLSGEPGGSVSWTGGPVDCTDCLITNASPTVTTTYMLSVIDGNGCETVEEYEVYVRNAVAAVIDLGQDTFACVNEGVQLNLEIDQSLVSIAWSTDEDGLSCYQNCPNPLASPEGLTTYQVEVTNVDGCKSIDSVTVDIIDDSREFVTDDPVICKGDSVSLNVDYGTSPQWTSEEFLACDDCPEIQVSPDTNALYFVQVLSENGCTIHDSVEVVVQEPMPVEAGGDEVACINEGTELIGTGTGQASWSPADLASQPNDFQTQVNPTETTMFFLTVDDGVCQNRDSLLVEVLTSAEVFAEGGLVCLGDTIELTGEGLAEDLLWYDNDENIIGTGTALPLVPRESEEITLVGVLNGCDSDTAYVSVEVIHSPVFGYPESITLVPEVSFQILPSVDSTQGYTFEWSPADGLSCADCPDPYVSLTDEKTFSVEIFDPLTGCSTTEDIEFKVRTRCNGDLFTVPNAFSPNQDGRNDEIFVYSAFIGNFTSWRVFDRWGAEVFNTTDMGQGWNGSYGGKSLPPGVYAYIIESICPIDGTTFYKAGDITLIR